MRNTTVWVKMLPHATSTKFNTQRMLKDDKEFHRKDECLSTIT